MNTKQPANERRQPSTDEQQRRDEAQFWVDWWREYAETWK